MNTSVLTLVRDRPAHLANLIRSLNAQTVPPAELVIAWMQPEPDTGLPGADFPIRHVKAPGRALPLARARNRAAEAARHDALIFLDVDCLASPALVGAYGQGLSNASGLYMGEVRYLPPGAVRDDGHGAIDYANLDALAHRHPARPAMPRAGSQPEPDPGQLWGLSFALTAADFWRAGGFDESYEGYGGEETDFAWRLASTGLGFYWLANARAWHQHHPLYRPPYPHFEAIIANARRFRARWGRWCMDYWLGLFTEAGLIEWSPSATDIRVLRNPSAREIENARLGADAVYG